MIKHLIEDDCVNDAIPLQNVKSNILAKVIECCKQHVAESTEEITMAVDKDLKSWDSNFMKIDQATLYGLMLAANYLCIKNLLDLTCQTVADMIKGNSP
ncbi:hypothetical protein GIB67_021125 [Kingdonia uniflora]|uniref:Uncharacterized protein n=1 Tax=Kingdonia uniflora TaxID=39325 RepID=A0A7J7N773_9MAGN|nr:hypothetical protein GIB67_021125 [Kingdonia uniflora]